MFKKHILFQILYIIQYLKIYIYTVLYSTVLLRGSRGLMDRGAVRVSGPAGIVGGGSE